MARLKKIMTVVGLTLVMTIFSVTPSFANQIIYEKIDEETISSGVIHKNIVRFGRGGWLNMNVVYLDLKDENIELKLLQSEEGLSNRETLSSMTEKTDNVVASMNADFFFMQTPSSPTGAIVRDGKMVSSPVIGEELATFYIYDDNRAFADYWDYNIYITTDKGKRVELGSINKYRWEYREIMLIDRNWATHSPGATDRHWDMVEIVVEDDEVVEVRSRQPGVEIPENGYVLLASAAKAYELYNNFQVGDLVTVHTEVEPDIENIKLAFGGGTILVKEGQIVPFTQSVTGAHPRTAIGITENRDRLIFLTVDGRHTSYKGLDGKQLAGTLIELGAHEAIIMDGGGSTTMTKRDLGEFQPRLINYPSEGIERRINNGIAVISTSSPQGLKGLKAKMDDERSFVGVSRKIDVKAFDHNYNPLGVDHSKVNLSLKSGEGIFNGMEFTPTKPGQVLVEVEYLGVTSEITLDVLDQLSYIDIKPSATRLKHGQSASFEVVGLDTEGYRSKINPKDILWADAGSLGSFKNGIYTAGNLDGVAKIEAVFDNHIASVNIAIDNNGSSNNNGNLNPSKPAIVRDRLNKAYEVEGEKLFVHSGVNFGNYTLLDKIAANKISSLINNNYGLPVFTGNVDSKLAGKIKKQLVSSGAGYSYRDHKDSLIIQVDNSGDGIRQTNFDQWPWLQNLVNTTNKKNVFVVMSKPIFGEGGFTDKLEADLLMDSLTKLYESGKQVFVVYEGENISVDIINGVRYISTGKYQSKDVKNPQEAFKYVEFNINDKEVTYQIKSLFQ